MIPAWRSTNRLLPTPLTTLIGAILAMGGVVGTALADSYPGLANFDVRYEAAGGKQAAAARTVTEEGGRESAEQRLRETVGRVAFSYDEVFNTPRFIRSTSNFLVEADPDNPRTPEEMVAGFIADFGGLLSIRPEELATTRVTRNATSRISGARNIRYQQQIGGIDVFGAELRATVTRQGHLLNVSSLLLNTVGQPGLLTPQQPQISAAQALVWAAANIGVQLESMPLVAEVGDGPDRRHVFAPSPDFWYPPTAALVYFPMSPSEVRIAWDVLVPEKNTVNLYRIIVDARRSEVLFRANLTEQAATEQIMLNVFTGDSPAPLTPFPPGTPRTFQAAPVSRELVTLIALDEVASPNGWMDDGDNTTEGNNCIAIIDRDFSQTADEVVEGDPPRKFDFALSLSNAPETYSKASCVNLFYWVNFCHDRMYQLGFDEISGNFQAGNFGRGGFGDDPVLALCQAGADFGFANNARFAAPPDGESGLMAMFVFDGPNPDRDSALEADIIIHEYTHGLSNRLHGSLSASQSRAMGEGWSDFYALCLLSEPGDDPDGIYPKGGYVTLDLGGEDFDQNYYFGIRRYPYSTDMTVNPLTFQDIDPTKIDLPDEVPISPLNEDEPPEFAAEAHKAGEVWCVTLWECRANIMAKEGFAGNETMLQIATEAMKISPPNPNFIQARDAIIQADIVVTGGRFFNELWAGFAKRGMGFSASAPGSGSNIGVIEASDFPRAVAAARSNLPGGPAPLKVSFRGVAENISQASRTNVWSFGTGDLAEGTAVEYTYTEPGTYLAVFEASDISGASAKASVPVTVLGQQTAGPRTSISATPQSGPVPLTVRFTASADGGEASIVSWNWAFGDGGGAFGRSVEYTFSRAGNFTVTMTATDTQGGQVVRSLLIVATGTTAGTVTGPPAGGTGTCGAIGTPAMILLVMGMCGLRPICRRRA